jgi:curved DNA-binding protein CbpA
MDNFALLGQPRLPWLDPVALKAAFLEQSARLHPDRVQAAGAEEKAAATARFAELNAAYNCLREPKERLLHLLELERARRPPACRASPRARWICSWKPARFAAKPINFSRPKGPPRRCCRRKCSSRRWNGPRGCRRCKSESSCGATSSWQNCAR